MEKLKTNSPVPGKAYFINEEAPVNCWDFLNRLLSALDCPSVQKSVSLKTAYRLGGLLEFLYKCSGKTSEPPMTRFLAKQLAGHHSFNISSARRDLDWAPKISIEEGIQRLKQ
jgi:nucleoside-diphosphate-sugar epimerase